MLHVFLFLPKAKIDSGELAVANLDADQKKKLASKAGVLVRAHPVRSHTPHTCTPFPPGASLFSVPGTTVERYPDCFLHFVDNLTRSVVLPRKYALL